MCCFSRPVEQVADTNIFARASKDGRQFLVYSMRMKAGEDLSMILPLPVPKDSPENAVTFINLEKYPDFFDEMRKGFPEPIVKSESRGNTLEAPKFEKLEVVQVGSFVASFVPSVADFKRLDEQFRLPTEVWEKLPRYKDWGFAVFKLEKGNKKVHPMAFEFPRFDRQRLFFPTVHIHDGTVPKEAAFDHALFLQSSEGVELTGWEESEQPAELFMTKLEASKGVVDGKEHCYRKKMRGRFENRDVIV